MPLSSLTLYTPGESANPGHRDLIATLDAIGLIGEADGHFQFLAGEFFFKHITFLGCAPVIPLLPEQDKNYLRINVPLLKSAVLFTGARTVAPLCAKCSQGSQGWKERVSDSRDAHLRCSHCFHSTPINELNFRKRACYSQSVIQIEPIFESEALPANGLLETLKTKLDCEFRYAYF